jgi:hypothetical protein
LIKSKISLSVTLLIDVPPFSYRIALSGDHLGKTGEDAILHKKEASARALSCGERRLRQLMFRGRWIQPVRPARRISL